jgi:hypothetical protein
VPSGQRAKNRGSDGVEGRWRSPQRPYEDGGPRKGCRHRINAPPDYEQFARVGNRVGSLQEHCRDPADADSGDGRSDDSVERPVGGGWLGKANGHEGGGESCEGRPEQSELHLPVQELIDLKGKGLLIDRSVVDLDEFAVSREEICSGHTDSPVLGDCYSFVIEVVSEREVELVEEKTGAALTVVVVDADEGDLVAELCVGLSKKWGLGPAGKAPGCPYIDNCRSIEVGQHLLKSRQVDLGQLRRRRFGLVTGAAGCDQDDESEETTHTAIMGWSGRHLAVGGRLVPSWVTIIEMERIDGK